MSNEKNNTNKSEREQKISKELAKTISKLNVQSARSKRRGIFGRVNPIIIVVTLIFGGFLIAALSSTGISTNKLTLGELVSGLQNNEYSELLVQDDGQIIARGKEFYYTYADEFTLKNSDKSSIKISKENEIKEVSFSEIDYLFKKTNITEQIRSLFQSKTEKIEDIVYIDNSVLVLTNEGYSDYIIKDTSKSDFEEILADNEIDLSTLGIVAKDSRIYAKDLSNNSINARVAQGSIDHIAYVDDIVLLSRVDSSVEQAEVSWSPAIFTFSEFLQREGFPISSDQATFIVDTRVVSGGISLDTILTIVTIGAFIFLGFVIFRSAQASGMGIMQFGQSKAKMFFGKKTGVTFKDVAGIDEAREELNEIVDFLKNPNKYRKLGARIPKGILMFGPPGTGKTLLARAIAGEAGVPFFHTSGSEFEEMLVGAGASRVRDLFAKAKKAAPALIFIDEIDAVARKRGTRIQSGSTEQTLNQILVEMDGFETNANIIVIAATNRPDVLDRAILRPGRFDRQVRIEAPDKDGRLEILKIHSKNKPLEATVDLEKVAKRTVGFTGADLENIMNEAAIIAAKDNRKEITNADIDDAVSKVVLGPAKKSRKRTEDELNLVAYHEAGHALVAKMTEGAVPVDKISIVSRGSTGGVTMFLPEKDENIISMKRLMADIRVSLGGRAAEEIVLHDISTGASNDIEQATRTARSMIQKYGMSKDLGLVQYGQSRDSEYLGYHYGDSQDYSEETAKMIDHEVRKLVEEEYKQALEIIKNNRHKLDELAKVLRDKEVLEKEEFEKLFE
ncbi:ATP-dependent zinc metalloprotease FtsH [Candidatus Dojkabacteria bacterium]|uniref:ATP-dependent zinc metalloprotease FtsH n=1 Tax=Candidatus Dojkabacteria bacterium TaxID=2099670 RepID=A0A955IC99_9BACT|nr:ATP-dependent zinc metalloprotease FtsH [Candidatus Dojkabacteria bacterium]